MSRSKPTIVLVPGLDGTALLFYRQIPLLSRYFRVETFPLPNDSFSTMDTLITSLRDWCDQRGLDRIVLCGESFGGALTLSFALAHPERLHGIVVINSFPRIRQRLRIRLAPHLIRIIPWNAMRLVRRLTESRLHSRHTSREDLREFHERTRAIGRDGYIRRLEILKDFDVRDRLDQIAVPALFLAGDLDKLVPSVREGRYMTSKVPNSQLVILEGYGHICLIDHDLDLLEYVQPWFEQTSMWYSAAPAHKG